MLASAALCAVALCGNLVDTKLYGESSACCIVDAVGGLTVCSIHCGNAAKEAGAVVTELADILIVYGDVTAHRIRKNSDKTDLGACGNNIAAGEAYPLAANGITVCCRRRRNCCCYSS